MEITIKLSEDAINQIAEKVAKIQSVGTQKEPLVSSNFIQTFTVDEVAKITNKNRRTIESHLKKGLLIGKKAGQNWIINEKNLNAYIGIE